jgi:hypothetical protein
MQVNQNLNKPGCPLIARHGAMMSQNLNEANVIVWLLERTAEDGHLSGGCLD